MATYREAVYMVLDYLKLSSDDSYYTEDHVRMLLNNFRSFVLKNKYEDNQKTPSSFPSSGNAQTLDLTLEHVNGVDSLACTGEYLRSIEEVPTLIIPSAMRIWAGTMFGDNIIITPPHQIQVCRYGETCLPFQLCYDWS